MTKEQIESFNQKKAELKNLKLESERLYDLYSDTSLKLHLSCDHRLPGGNIAGLEFKGSYSGFICQICGCGVSYEKTGY